MLWVPNKGIIRVEHNNGTTGTQTPGTAVTTHASVTSTKGTRVQLIASTLFDAYWIKVVASNYGLAATTARGCLDIMIGAATSEIIIADLLMGFCGGTGAGTTPGCGPKVWEFPLYIPAGSELSAQVAGDRLSTAMRVWVFLYGGNGYPPFRVGQKVTTYGIGTVPAGTTITPGASGAEGNWTQITASSSSDHFAFVPSLQPPTGDITLTPVKWSAVDIGTGAATEEALLGSEHGFQFRVDSGEQMEGPINSFPAFQDIASGQRMVMRVSAGGALDTVNTQEVALHAVS